MATGCLHPSPLSPAMPLPGDDDPYDCSPAFEADLNGDADEGFARRVDGPQSEAKVAELISLLPKDIVAEILSRVPPDSLVEAKRVSKSWYAFITELISNVVFVSKHLYNTKNQSSKCLAFSDLKFNPAGNRVELHEETFSLITIFNDQTPSIIEEFDLPLPPPEVFDYPGPRRVIFQCDGIVCLVQLPRTIYICNPVLHECRIVPEFGSSDFEAIGIGYDSRAKDYKLVMIFNDGVYQSKVYSLNHDSWKVIKMPEDLNIRRFNACYEGAFYWSGACYWLVEGTEALRMVCFDICDEEFYVLNLPEIHGRKNRTAVRLNLTTWNDSLALHIYYVDYNLRHVGNSPLSFEIFVADGHSAFKSKGCPSWIQRCVSPPLDIWVTFSPIEDDELLLHCKDYRLSTYNIRTHKRNEVMGQDTDALCDWLFFYEKSLVSVKKMKKLST